MNGAIGGPCYLSAFEEWVASPVQQIMAGVDDLLDQCGADPSDIDRVFLTGGSARVPRVRALFDERFGAERVTSGDHLTSVASGLAQAALS